MRDGGGEPNLLKLMLVQQWTCLRNLTQPMWYRPCSMKNIVRSSKGLFFKGPHALLMELVMVFALVSAICFAVTYKLGGPDHPVGTMLTITPLILISVALAPIFMQEMMKDLGPFMELCSLRCQCARMRIKNNRENKELRKLKRKIRLGWLDN